MTRPATTSLVWFRDDLRVSDHPALAAAWAKGGPIIAVYIMDKAAARRPLGAAARWWLHGSLVNLRKNLAALGIPLILRRGATATILNELVDQTGATSLVHGRAVDDVAARLEADIRQALRGKGLEMNACLTNLLYGADEVRSASGDPYRVFSPFWRAALASKQPRPPIAPLRGQRAGAGEIAGDDLAAWHLLPSRPDWAANFVAHGTPGEEGAATRLDAFADEELRGYADNRDRPDLPSTSRLSAHLRFGDISPHQVWQAALVAQERGLASSRDVQKFQAELGWREFAHHLLWQFPELERRNFQPRFDAFPWRDDEPAFIAWTRGMTGYPIIDAGMRQLWTTGFMHNRVRMIAASFLVKHLLIDWRRGEQWFWDTLVDACPANNTASWQWVAGTGADAAPYFRIFNPLLQGVKFDPQGDYVRRFVPELARLPADIIHRPWEAGGLILADAGVRLGKTYPYPVVSLEEGRARALAALACIQDERRAV